MTDYEAEIWVTHYLQIALGEVSEVSDTVKRLYGRQGESLAEYLKKNVGLNSRGNPDIHARKTPGQALMTG